MRTNFYEIMKGWTSNPWNREKIDSTLDYVGAAFTDKELAFLLIDDLYDWLEQFDGPFDSMMPSKQKQQQFQIFLDNKETIEVSRSLDLEVEESPELRIAILNADDVITKYPSWFEKYKPTTWDDVEETLRKAMEEKKGK